MAQASDATVADWYKTSPFALSAPQTNAGLLAPAALPMVNAPSAAGSVATVDPNAYDPGTKPNASMTAATGWSTGYDPSAAAGTNWNVDAPQTVQGQLKGLLDTGSPLMTQAATRAAESANGRGLLNSSMAVGAGQSAVIGAALPIAQQDAQTYAGAGRYAADTANTMAQFNTAAKTRASEFTAAATNTQALAEQQAREQTSQVNTTQANALQSQLLQQRQQAEQTNAAAKNAAATQAAQLSLTAQTANLGAAVQQSGQVYDSAVKIAMQNTDQAGKLQLQQIDAATRAQLAEMQAKYNVQMQASSSMAGTYQALINQSAAIMSDQNLDFAGKQAALKSLTTVFNNAMDVQSNISGLNLGTLLEPGALTGGVNATATGPADGVPPQRETIGGSGPLNPTFDYTAG